MTNATSLKLRFVLSFLLGCVLVAAAPASAQTTANATSTFTVQTSGTVGTTSRTAAAPAGGTATPEAISCTGPVKLSTSAVTDPTLPPGVVVSVDARGLSCVGQTTKTVYLNSGQANLTRPLAATDVVQTTFAVYPNTAGGYMNARTAMVTLNLSYNTTTGALTSASGTISAF